MSTPNETILITVDIAANNARLVELTKQLNENRDAQKALAEAGKAGRVSADELAAGQVRLKQQAAALTGEVRTLTKANADQQKATDAARGSIAQLRAELALGTAAYNSLSASERDSTEAGQKLQAGNRALSDQLKTLEKAVGDTRRNVGNYKEDVIGALRETNLFGTNVGQAADSLKGNLTQGLNIAKAGFGSLKAAIVSTGIGLLVTLFGSLYEYLKSTDEGAEALAAAFAGLKAGAEVLQGYVISLGKSLYEAFTNPRAAIESIGKFLVDVVTNPRKAFNDFVKGVESGIQVVKTRVGEAVVAGRALSQAQNELEDRERAAIELTVKQRNEVERLISTNKDRNLTEQQRIGNLREAGRIENEILNRTISIERERLRILVEQEALSARNGKRSDEADKRIEDQKARLAGLAGESATLQQTIANRISAQQQAQAAALAAAVAADLAADKARLEAAAAQLASEDKARILNAQRDEKARAETKANELAAYTAELAMLERNLDQRRVLLEADKAAGLSSQQQYDARLAVIDEGGFAARLLLARHYNQDANEADKARTRFHNTELEKQTAKERQEQGKRVAIAQAFGTELGALVAQSLTDAGQSLESFAGKFLILILDTLEKQVLAGQVAILVGSLAKEGIAGLIEAAALTATVTAAFEGVKAIISTQTSPGFATGGLITGPGTGTSDSIPARLSNGESVMNANTTAMFAPLLSHLNVLGGGVAFATGGLVPSAGRQGAPRANDGGFVARSLGGGLIDYTALASALERVSLSVGVRVIDQAAKKYNGPRSYGQLG
jgi:hypothetical protein